MIIYNLLREYNCINFINSILPLNIGTLLFLSKNVLINFDPSNHIYSNLLILNK